MPDPCPECGADRVLVGRVHNCRPRVEAPVAPEKKIPAAAPREKRARAAAALRDGESRGAARQRRYRQAHPEKHREYMRGYMAKRRAKS